MRRRKPLLPKDAAYILRNSLIVSRNFSEEDMTAALVMAVAALESQAEVIE